MIIGRQVQRLQNHPSKMPLRLLLGFQCGGYEVARSKLGLLEVRQGIAGDFWLLSVPINIEGSLGSPQRWALPPQFGKSCCQHFLHHCFSTSETASRNDPHGAFHNVRQPFCGQCCCAIIAGSSTIWESLSWVPEKKEPMYGGASSVQLLPEAEPGLSVCRSIAEKCR